MPRAEIAVPKYRLHLRALERARDRLKVVLQCRLEVVEAEAVDGLLHRGECVVDLPRGLVEHGAQAVQRRRQVVRERLELRLRRADQLVEVMQRVDRRLDGVVDRLRHRTQVDARDRLLRGLERAPDRRCDLVRDRLDLAQRGERGREPVRHGPRDRFRVDRVNRGRELRDQAGQLADERVDRCGRRAEIEPEDEVDQPATSIASERTGPSAASFNSCAA